MKQPILNSWQENKTLTNQTQITIVLKSNLCDCNDTYILVIGNILIAGNIATWVAFRNCTSFSKCITKVDGITIDEVEDLDVVMLIYNLLDYSSNYSDMTGSSWLYSNTEASKSNVNIAGTNAFICFKYKIGLVGSNGAAMDF